MGRESWAGGCSSWGFPVSVSGIKGGQVTVGRRMYSHAKNSLLIQETTDFEGLVGWSLGLST